MKIKYKYSYIIDIIYHIFAHIKVCSASNLYDEDYIKMMSTNHLDDEMNKISLYYNENFNRLASIQFILTDATTINDVENILLSFNMFTEDDKTFFILPFLDILNNVDKSYSDYWNEINNTVEKTIVETGITERFNELTWLFDKYNKDIEIYLSYSINKNGRGIYSPNKFQAVVPYPYHVNPKYDIDHSFYMAFHEITHQITDNMIGTIINMDDGSHDLSENIVIRVDYYWLKNKKAYLKWIAKLIDSDELLSVDMFENIFKLPNEIVEKLL